MLPRASRRSSKSARPSSPAASSRRETIRGYSATMPDAVASRVHQFYAIAFVENLSLRALAPSFPTARVSPHEIYIPADEDGGVYIYPFGAVVMHDLPPQRREAELVRLHKARPGLTTQVIREDYAVRED